MFHVRVRTVIVSWAQLKWYHSKRKRSDRFDVIMRPIGPSIYAQSGMLPTNFLSYAGLSVVTDAVMMGKGGGRGG